MHFFQPFASVLFATRDYERLARLLEDRDNIEILRRRRDDERARREERDETPEGTA